MVENRVGGLGFAFVWCQLACLIAAVTSASSSVAVKGWQTRQHDIAITYMHILLMRAGSTVWRLRRCR